VFKQHHCLELMQLIKECWDGDASVRPTFAVVLERLQEISTNFATKASMLSSSDRSEDAASIPLTESDESVSKSQEAPTGKLFH
jgi:hypothetical protein